MLFMATLQNFCDQERRSQLHHSFDRPRDTGANNITVLMHLATPAQTASQNFYNKKGVSALGISSNGSGNAWITKLRFFIQQFLPIRIYPARRHTG